MLAGSAAAQDVGGALAPDIRIQLVAPRSAMLSSEMAGRVAELTVREGESFAAGQRLVVLDCDAHRARLERAQAQVAAARRALEVKTRLKDLNSIGALDVELASAERAVAEADLVLAKEIVERCTILAPFAGTAGEVKIKRWQFVKEGEPLLEVLDMADLEAELLVPSRWLTWLKPGARFQVGIEETGRAYAATVRQVAPRVDPVSQSAKVFAVIAGRHEELRPGMSGRALLQPPQ